MDITVAICTYNGAARLPEVLGSLAEQTAFVGGSSPISWEIIIVDNNSGDRTPQVVRSWQLSSVFGDCLRYVHEPRQGLAFARRRAIRAARGSLVAFLDDDNLPDERWVQAAYDFGRSHPTAGAYGSQISGRYETPPPAGFERIACFLAVIDRGTRPFRYDQLDRWLFPAGAGLVVRKKAWIQSVPDRPVLTGVSANELTGKGEDIETLSYFRKRGWAIWHNPAMRIEHVIKRDRLTESYLIKLFKGVGISRYHTRTLRFSPWQKASVVLAYTIKDIGHLLIHRFKNCQHSASLVTTCERTLLYYSILSPFYHFKSLIGNLASRLLSRKVRPLQIDSS